MNGCDLCKRLETIAGRSADEQLRALCIARLDQCSVFLGDNQGSPGWCMLVLNEHHEHLAELPASRQSLIFAEVAKVAAAIRAMFPSTGTGGGPPRINYECLGNLSHHIHWHVIPRHMDDATPTQAVWGWSAEQLRGTLTAAERLELARRLRDAMGVS